MPMFAHFYTSQNNHFIDLTHKITLHIPHNQSEHIFPDVYTYICHPYLNDKCMQHPVK